MLKNILKLEGAQKLTANEQKSINGAGAPYCPPGYCSTRTVLVDGEYYWTPCFWCNRG